jgi:hypothetical protein
MNQATTSNASDFGPHVPQDKVQYRVLTPYGEGLTIRTRKPTKTDPQMRQIELVDWKNALHATNAAQKSPQNVRPAYLYSSQDFPSVSPQVGDEVMCTFGRGKVTEIRQGNESTSNHQTVVVLLSSWRMAHRSRVTCYLRPTDVHVVRPKRIYEMSVHERVDAAYTYKDQAAIDFNNKQYQEALTSYAKAIDAVRYVQHKSDSDNYVRADLLVVMVTCTNNAAMCAKHLEHWEECYNFGKNAQVLLDAIEKKKGMKIYQILAADGYHDMKLFGEWKVKSLVLQARALLERQELNEAMQALKQAHEIITSYTTMDSAVEYPSSVKTLRSLEKEVKRLHTRCKNCRSNTLKKEKLRAAAMFGNHSSNEIGDPAKGTTRESNGIVREKENRIPNGSGEISPTSSDQSIPRVVETIPLKDSPESKLKSSPLEHSNGEPFKRRVSFSEKVTSYQIPDVNDVPKANAIVTDDTGTTESTANTNNLNGDKAPLKELPWYQDQDLLVGAAIFGGAVVASSFLVSTLLRSRK